MQGEWNYDQLFQEAGAAELCRPLELNHSTYQEYCQNMWHDVLLESLIRDFSMEQWLKSPKIKCCIA